MSDKDVNGYEGLLWFLSSVAKNWKQPKCPSTEETINRPWYMHTMEHCSAMKWNNLPTHLTTRENLRVTMLSERSWNQRVNPLQGSIPMTFWKRQNFGDRKQLTAVRGWGVIDYPWAQGNVWGDEWSVSGFFWIVVKKQVT